MVCTTSNRGRVTCATISTMRSRDNLAAGGGRTTRGRMAPSGIAGSRSTIRRRNSPDNATSVVEEKSQIPAVASVAVECVRIAA
jgi:hypothetical protein